MVRLWRPFSLLNLALFVCCHGTSEKASVTNLDVLSSEDSSQEQAWQDGWGCRPGETKCLGSIFLECKSDGSDWIALQCPADHVCTSLGCVLRPGDYGKADAMNFDSMPSTPDTAAPAQDLPQDQAQKDAGIGPADVSQDSGGLTDASEEVPSVTGPTTCGNNPPCEPGETCCAFAAGLACVAINQCPRPDACISQTDCPSNKQCCPPQFGPPGAPGTCKESCGGTSTWPICDSAKDCTHGQECVFVVAVGICLTTCSKDADCLSKDCQELAAFGYHIASVCSCENDTHCPGLKCCEIPYLGAKTCLTECVSF